MSAKRTGTSLPTTLSFDVFWRYLESHPNCIVRAGTPESTLFDDDDIHWHFAKEPDGTLVVELIRGKKLVGDLVIAPAEVGYVEVHAEERDEWRFDLIAESEKDRVATHFFVMSHGYEGEEAAPTRDGGGGRWTH